ncbi:IPExxxVDY family protein [uncultured Mesonia sp.]|uniref:IPExxxVDY family protein n=1 Tax=uncultured Mesonia sp. TaxID=399731 RepID=UPI00374F4DD9
MAYKLLVDELLEDDFYLIGIHTSLEHIRLAYFANKYLQLQFKRCASDLDFKTDEQLAYFALFHHQDIYREVDYYLVENKISYLPQKKPTAGSLFQDLPTNTRNLNLIPEYPKVDFWLKIENESDENEILGFVSKLKEINQVLTAYTIDATKLKSKHHLIFN